jgi:ribonucleoside-diphosphate reductase beta chain
VIEGYLALGGQRSLLRFFKAVGLMPGFYTGFTAVARDESRHIGFGVMALRRRVREEPELARAVALKILELAEPTVQTVVNPDNLLRIPHPETARPELRQNPLELRQFSLDQTARRLRAVGLSDATIDEVLDAYRGHYEKYWSVYEQKHGVEHPVRWYQRQPD